MEKTRLKVAFLSRYVGKVNRGVETYVLELSKRLSKRHKVDIFSGSDADNIGKVINNHYDVVIATNGRLQSLKCSLGRLTGRYKLIIPGQSGVGRDDWWNIVITRPDVYVALTDFEKKWASRWAWKSRVVKIPNGVDLANFTPVGPKVDFGLPKPVILSVGALEWYKHHERTIEALRILNKGSLVIVGSGSLEKKLMELAKEKLGEKRFLITKTSYEEIPKYYRSAELFVLPSWIHESFGIVYVEAMASGLPVVAPDDLPRREIIGDAGVLTDVCNPKEYAKAMGQILSRKMGNIPRSQAEKFSWDKVGEQYQNLFEEMFG